MHAIFIDDHGRIRSGWRALIFVLLLAIFTIAMSAFIGSAADRIGFRARLDGRAGFAYNSAISLIAAAAASFVAVRMMDRLPFRSLGASFTAGWFRHLVCGLGIGTATLAAALIPAIAYGSLRFSLTDLAASSLAEPLLTSLAVMALASAFEELLFRGYFLQTFMRSGLTWLAILMTSGFFGLVHLGNPDAGPISTTNTMLAGLWFAAAYIRTRDLWFAWGIHLAWNFAQGAIFGIEVSGLTQIARPSVLVESDGGPLWLTGGDYGIEASIGCTAAILISIAAIRYLPCLEPDPELVEMTSASEEATITRSVS